MQTHRTPTRRELLLATGGALAVGLAGCTDGTAQGATPGDSTPTPTAAEDPDHSHHDDHHHEDVPDEPQPAAEVAMLTNGDSHHFSPHVTWIEAGGTVTFVNESGAHTATAYAPELDKPRRIPEGGNAFDTGLLTEAGATAEFTFETPGVYDYYCIPHEGMGMIGSLIVGEPDPHDQPGLSEPTDVPESTHEKIRSLNETVSQALGDTHEETATPSGDDHHDETPADDGHDDHDH